jgi:predicted transcriptional regulator
MRAHDLAAPFPTVTLGTSALEAARLLAANDLPGLIVVDGRGHPTTVLAGTQVLRMAIPRYCIDDPTLARVVDEEHADTFMADLADRTVSELLPERPGELPVVDPDATVLEIAALMARARSPLVAVVGDGEMQGAITLDALLDRMLGT